MQLFWKPKDGICAKSLGVGPVVFADMQHLCINSCLEVQKNRNSGNSVQHEHIKSVQYFFYKSAPLFHLSFALFLFLIAMIIGRESNILDRSVLGPAF